MPDEERSGTNPTRYDPLPPLVKIQRFQTQNYCYYISNRFLTQLENLKKSFFSSSSSSSSFLLLLHSIHPSIIHLIHPCFKPSRNFFSFSSLIPAYYSLGSNIRIDHQASATTTTRNSFPKHHLQPTYYSSDQSLSMDGIFRFRWLVDSVLWKHLRPSTTILPKELVLEILSRLPSTSVIRFRLVCKEWCLLTSTQYFIEMHVNNHQPTPFESGFVVQYLDRQRNIPLFQLKTFFINEKATNRNKKFQMVREYIDLTQARHHKYYHRIDLLSSYKGFLLFTAKPPRPDMESALIFYNPVTKEQLTVTAPPSSYVYCGFFFHSPTKEYRILYRVVDRGHKDGAVRFELLGLQTRSLRKIYMKKMFSAKYLPDLSTPAVISNGALHWMVSETLHKKFFGAVPSCSETILSFGMESEEFCLMPHPRFDGGRHDCVSLRRTDGHKMNLLEMDGGILCLCDGYDCLELKILKIFVMENYEKWTWVQRHVFPFHAYPGPGIRDWVYYDRHVKALQIHQGQLLLYYRPCGSYLEESLLSNRDAKAEYLLYPLNQDAKEDEPGDASYKFIKWLSFGRKNFEEKLECFDDDNLISKKKKKKKEKEKSRFKVAINQLILKKNKYLDDDQTIRKIKISHPGTELRWISEEQRWQFPSASVRNIVVFTPSLASLQHHNGNGNGNGNGGGNYILSLQLVNHSTTVTEYDVQTRKWRRVLVLDSSSSSR